MKNLGVHLSWIVVKDLDAAITFYTKTAQFLLHERAPEYGWAELRGVDGSRLGIEQENARSLIRAGSNAIMTVMVPDIEQARLFFQEKGAHLIGDICTIPGHVKLQTFKDLDGNLMQLVEML